MENNPLTHANTVINAISHIDARDTINIPLPIPLWWMLATIWGLGVVSVATYHALRHRSFIRMVRRWSCPVADIKIIEILEGLRSELKIKKHIELKVSPVITSPMLVGFFRPTILLPPLQFSDDELSMILKHELIHLKRYDLWCKALVLTATVLHWFNPMVYLMSRAMAAQCEISCDALVLQGVDFQGRKQYGEAIIAVIKNGAKPQTALSTNFYGGKRNMKNRISFIMDTKRKKAGFIILCMALACILTTGAAIAEVNDPQETTRPEVMIAPSNSDSDNINEVTHFLKLLRRPYSDRTNANSLQESIRPEVVVAPPNNGIDSDNEVTNFLSLLKKQRNVHQAK
jgi:beta-lactamase regulating signal transducer with metallopeptidase domain